MSDSVQAPLKAHGVTVEVRAPIQHALFIERRGAVLRLAFHTIEDQPDKARVGPLSCIRLIVDKCNANLLELSSSLGNAVQDSIERVAVLDAAGARQLQHRL